MNEMQVYFRPKNEMQGTIGKASTRRKFHTCKASMIGFVGSVLRGYELLHVLKADRFETSKRSEFWTFTI
jgi:hypothetical protein